ncbi:MAG: hypothetical protein ACFE9L_14955 [Candidatus Hodarchaeota archaeon]
MVLDVLIERPTEETTKCLVIFRLILIVIAISLGLIPLELSNYAGTLSKTHLGFFIVSTGTFIFSFA